MKKLLGEVKAVNGPEDFKPNCLYRNHRMPGVSLFAVRVYQKNETLTVSGFWIQSVSSGKTQSHGPVEVKIHHPRDWNEIQYPRPPGGPRHSSGPQGAA